MKIVTMIETAIKQIIENIFQDFLAEEIEQFKPKVVEIKLRQQDVLLEDFLRKQKVDKNWLPLLEQKRPIQPRDPYPGYPTYPQPRPPKRPRTEEENRLIEERRQVLVWPEFPEYVEYFNRIQKLRELNADWWEYPRPPMEERTEYENKILKLMDECFGHPNEIEWFAIWDHATSKSAMEEMEW